MLFSSASQLQASRKSLRSTFCTRLIVSPLSPQLQHLYLFFLNEEARRFLFDERHLDERVVRWCRLTSWTDRRGVPWLQTPYYDRDGKLVGVQNRNLIKGALPRFRFPQGSECGIYNLVSILYPSPVLSPATLIE